MTVFAARAAAEFTWTGEANDGLWESTGNWSVGGSAVAELPKPFDTDVFPATAGSIHPSQSPACSYGMCSVPAASSVTPVTTIFPERFSVPAPRFTSDFTIVLVQ